MNRYNIADIAEYFVLFLLFTFVALTCGVMGHKSERKQWQAETIERGYAEHDAITGEWQWKGAGDVK